MKAKRKVFFSIPFLVLVLIFVFGLASCGKSSTEIKELEVETEKANILFDIPSLLDKNAWEIKDILGEPSIFYEPTGSEFGTLSWIKEIKNTKNSLMFGFDFYKDGSIAENTLILTSAREEGEPNITLDDVLEAGNLDKDSDEYTIEIKTQKDEMINLWIIKK